MSVQYRRLSLFAATAFLALAPTLTASAPAAAQSAQQAPNWAERSWLQQQFAAYDAKRQTPPSGAPTELAQSLATWDWLRRTPAVGQDPALTTQAQFLSKHAGWPSYTTIRRRAEAQAADPRKSTDSAALAFFQQIPPETAAGQARYALVSSGAVAERMAKLAWARPSIPADLEPLLRARFGDRFTAAEHLARADALIWAGQTTAAGRVVGALEDDARTYIQARLALRSNAPDAEARFASVPAKYRRDIALAYDRATWLERNGRTSEAESLLASGDFTPGTSSAETWLEKRLAMGRAAMRRGDNQLAHRLLANHRVVSPGLNPASLPLSVRVDLSDTEWLAGWIALRKLNRPDTAQKHFLEFNKAVTTPISQSRGDYWLGRAEKARGQTAAAKVAFERAALNFDYFYGQLAAEELGRTPQLPKITRVAVTAAEQASFENQSLARALTLLVNMGSDVRASMFVRSLASSVETPTQARAAANLADKLKRPDLGVWTWKTARPRGDFSTFDQAFPRFDKNAPIPARDWIISQAIARQESSFDRTALSHAGARGLMQLMPATAADVAKKLGLTYDVNRLFSDPNYNVQMGSYYIGVRRDNFSNRALAIAAYNAGAGNVRKWITAYGDPRTTVDPIDWVEMIPFSETRTYVQRVTENGVVYSLLEPERQGADPYVSKWLRGN